MTRSRAVLAKVSIGLLLATLAAAVPSRTASAATLPSGFVESSFGSGLNAPTAMAFAPDGRLFVTQQGGALRVVKNGVTLATPFVSLNVDSNGERGLLGVALDPNFATNHYLYVYYTTATAPVHNRVSRFTANGDVAAAGSETPILNLDNLSNATNHNGGAIHFSPVDGKLYVGVGDNANGANAQTLSNRLGKMLRINANGSIPTDNPFYNSATGANRAIWALGLRNPYTFSFQRTTGRLFINDVGQNTWEEIDEGAKGANYGWPNSEGPTGSPYKTPYYAYQHSAGTPTGCAITGGTFYNPPVAQFGSGYVGDYFFADFCGGWIYRIETAGTKTVTKFATGIAAPVDLTIGSDGSLYYLAHDAGAVVRVRMNPPTTARLTFVTTPPGLRVTVDGHTVVTPYAITARIGSSHTISAPRQSAFGGVQVFQRWSDGGAATHTVTVPSNGRRFTALFAGLAPSTPNGLTGLYFDGCGFNGRAVARVDRSVNFNWGTAAPVAGFGPDGFSVRWVGSVIAPRTQTFTFYTRSDDGSRLWVDDRLIIDNWRSPTHTERAGTIVLTQGHRYSLRLDYYESAGPASIQLSWSGPGTAKALVPSAALFPAVGVNFAPPRSARAEGYRQDNGTVYGARSYGLSYGWNATTATRERGIAPDQRYDTLAATQLAPNSNARWQIALPNGHYYVRLVAGDPRYFDSVYKLAAEGVTVISAVPTSSRRFIDNTKAITVSDGRLTVTNVSGARNNKLCYLEITPRP